MKIPSSISSLSAQAVIQQAPPQSSTTQALRDARRSAGQSPGIEQLKAMMQAPEINRSAEIDVSPPPSTSRVQPQFARESVNPQQPARRPGLGRIVDISV